MTRLLVSVLGAVLLAAFGLVRCGPGPEPTPPVGLAQRLEVARVVPGPPPGPGDRGLGEAWRLGHYNPGSGLVAARRSEAGGLLLWRAWGWVRGGRLGPDGTPRDPTIGVLMDPGRPPIPASDTCDGASVGDTWLVACRSLLTVWPPDGPPVTRAAPWSFDVRIAGGSEVALVPVLGEDPSGLVHRFLGLDATGALSWEAAVPADRGSAWPVATGEGFLVLWAGEEGVAARPITSDGVPGEAVPILPVGSIRGVAAGPAGVLAWIAEGEEAHLIRLDPLTGAGQVRVSGTFPDAHGLVAVEDGWILEAGATGWHVDAEFAISPVTLPVPDVDEHALASDGTEVLLATLEAPEVLRAGPLVDGAWAPRVVATGIERHEVLAVASGDAGRLVIQAASPPPSEGEPRPLALWRVGPEGARLDDEAVLLAPEGPLSVDGDGARWLLAVGEVGAARLFSVTDAGSPSEVGRVVCESGAPSGSEVAPTPSEPAVVALDDGWLVACAARAVGTGTDEVWGRTVVQRFGADLSPAWPEPRVLGTGALWGGSLKGGVEVGPDVVLALGGRLVAVDPADGALLAERPLENVQRVLGITGEGDRLVVAYSTSAPPYQRSGLVLEGLDDPEPVTLESRQLGGVRVAVRATRPAILGGDVWICQSTLATTFPTDFFDPVPCDRFDADTGALLETVEVVEPGEAGDLVAEPGGLVLGYGIPGDGTLRGALALLGGEGGDGDGGDAGDAEPVPDGDGGDAGDAEGPGDGGDVRDAGGPGDGGDAGDTGDIGDTEGPGDGDGGTAPGSPGDEGCEGCGSSSGSALTGLLLLLALQTRRRTPSR